MATDKTYDIDVTTEMELPVSKGTIIRAIMAVLVVVDIVLKALGHDVTGITDTAVYEVVSPIYDIVVLGYCYWKNNSWRKKAKLGDAVKDGVIEIK